MKIKLYKLLEMIDKYNNAEDSCEIPPPLIEFNNCKFLFEMNSKSYLFEGVGKDIVKYIADNYFPDAIPSLEVEILEVETTKTETDKVIEPFKYDNDKLITNTGNYYTLRVIDKIIMAKINEIIKIINRRKND